MKTNFQINVQVSLGVTPELTALVAAILAKTPAAIEPQAVETTPTTAPAAPAAEPQQEPTPEPQQPAATEPQQPAAAPEEPAAKPLTAEDVRAAMHRARQRIEGEDYKDNTQSEAYKRYHRQLTAEFKNIAALLGADKPSALPEEQRAQFIAQCDELGILDNGTIGVTNLPF